MGVTAIDRQKRPGNTQSATGFAGDFSRQAQAQCFTICLSGCCDRLPQAVYENR
jgi:hypothetical protein